ncbi:MAG: ClpXP protease specificity-enhancing factor SspB [Hyphomicrobiales bacterium]|nr:ClpXP protease specificity-enhancing factor SspB [Hyphomicrobiales bacterium]
MSDDTIEYDVLALDAMRGVIRTVLQRVQKRGMPGEHHFFISFDTSSPSVLISKRLKDRYPDEMTIVIQHQFWDLQVWDDRFEVKLSFNNVPERLVVPFSAVRRFHDPSVDFGFNLQVFDPAARAALQHAHAAAEGHPGVPLLVDQSGGADEAAQDDGDGQGKRSAEIVKLDTFRKK